MSMITSWPSSLFVMLPRQCPFSNRYVSLRNPKSSSPTFNSIFDILRCIPKHFLIISETGCFYIILVAPFLNERYLYLREHHSHFSKKFLFQNCPYWQNSHFCPSTLTQGSTQSLNFEIAIFKNQIGRFES